MAKISAFFKKYFGIVMALFTREKVSEPSILRPIDGEVVVIWPLAGKDSEWFSVLTSRGMTSPHLVDCMSLVTSDLTKVEVVAFYHRVLELVDKNVLPAAFGLNATYMKRDLLTPGTGIFTTPIFTLEDFST